MNVIELELEYELAYYDSAVHRFNQYTMRTHPELIGQIKNFMGKDRHVSIETIGAQFDVSVGTVHTIIHEELKMRKICAKFVQRVLREDQKERCCHDSREMVKLINSDSTVLDALVACDENWICCYDPETKRQSSQWKHAGSPRPKKARESKSTLKLLMIPFFDSTGMIYMHWVTSGQTVNKEYYVEVLREFRKRFRWKRPALFKSGQWHFHQDNVPVHNSILVTDYLTKMGIKTVWRCPWCSRYCRRKWTRRHEFNSWTRLIAFHIALIPLGKV